MLPQLVGPKPLAVVPAEVGALAADDDQHAAAGRAAVRLDDEVVAAAEQLRQLAQLRVPVSDGVDRRRRHADARTGAHAQLVIDDGIGCARVVVEDAGGVAPVHPENAAAAEPFGAE